MLRIGLHHTDHTRLAVHELRAEPQQPLLVRTRRLGPAKKEFARIRLRGWLLNLHVCGVCMCGVRGCTPSLIHTDEENTVSFPCAVGQANERGTH